MLAKAMPNFVVSTELRSPWWAVHADGAVDVTAVRRSSGEAAAQVQVLDAAVDRRVEALRRCRQLEPLEAVEEVAGTGSRVRPGRDWPPCRSEAPEPKARWWLGWRSIRKLEGVVEHVLVAVGRGVEQRHLVPRGDPLPRISQSSVAVRMKWMIGLTHRRISSTASGSSSGSALQLLPLVGVLGEGQQAAADGVTGRLVARLHQQLGVVEQLLLASAAHRRSHGASAG